MFIKILNYSTKQKWYGKTDREFKKFLRFEIIFDKQWRNDDNNVTPTRSMKAVKAMKAMIAMIAQHTQVPKEWRVLKGS